MEFFISNYAEVRAIFTYSIGSPLHDACLMPKS